MLLVSSVVVLIASIYFLIFSKLLWSVRGCEKFKYPETLIIELRRSSHETYKELMDIITSK